MATKEFCGIFRNLTDRSLITGEHGASNWKEVGGGGGQKIVAMLEGEGTQRVLR